MNAFLYKSGVCVNPGLLQLKLKIFIRLEPLLKVEICLFLDTSGGEETHSHLTLRGWRQVSNGFAKVCDHDELFSSLILFGHCPLFLETFQ